MSVPNIELTVQGSIDTCTTKSSNTMYCKFGFVTGSDWEAISGSKAGVTYTSRTNSHQEATFNYPVGISLCSPSPYGWPQIVLAVYGLNNFGNDKIVGYGCVHLPVAPGKHIIDVPLFAPQAEGFMEKLSAFFTGLYPELIDVNLVAQGGEDRPLMKTHSQGKIQLTLNVVISNVEANGFRID